MMLKLGMAFPIFIGLGCGGLVDGAPGDGALDSSLSEADGLGTGAQGSGAATHHGAEDPTPGSCGLRIELGCVTCFQESWESACQEQRAVAADPTCRHVSDCLDVHCGCEGPNCSSFCDCLTTCAEPGDECLTAWRQLIACGSNECQAECL